MVKQRRRFKQTTTLAQRLAEEANCLRERAKSLSPGPEKTALLGKIRQAETALRIDAWLTSPGDVPPGDVMTLIEKDHKKRQAKLPAS